jgi:exo-beta-1,3-glucanase (GH17 family)
MNDLKMASELVAVSKELTALNFKADVLVEPDNQDQVDSLAEKLLSRLGPAKSHTLKVYGIDLRPSDTVQKLAQAWAKVLLG